MKNHIEERCTNCIAPLPQLSQGQGPPGPRLCLHCGAAREPGGDPELCPDCAASPQIAAVYRRSRRFGRKWTAHLMRLRERAMAELPLFDPPLPEPSVRPDRANGGRSPQRSPPRARTLVFRFRPIDPWYIGLPANAD